MTGLAIIRTDNRKCSILFSKKGREVRFIQDILAIKPDFPVLGKRLIGRFIKFENLVESILEGLKATGLKLD